MKKLLPLITVLVLLTSCQGFLDSLHEALHDGSIGNHSNPIVESMCETIQSDSLISFVYKIKPDLIDVSEIENIKYSLTYSDGGVENLEWNINLNEDFDPSQVTISNSRNTSIEEIIIYPNLTEEDNNTPLDVVEILLDMPGGEVNPTKNVRSSKVESHIFSISKPFIEKDCCTTISAVISDVEVTLKGGEELKMRLPGCYRVLDIGECCDL